MRKPTKKTPTKKSDNGLVAIALALVEVAAAIRSLKPAEPEQPAEPVSDQA